MIILVLLILVGQVLLTDGCEVGYHSIRQTAPPSKHGYDLSLDSITGVNELSTTQWNQIEETRVLYILLLEFNFRFMVTDYGYKRDSFLCFGSERPFTTDFFQNHTEMLSPFLSQVNKSGCIPWDSRMGIYRFNRSTILQETANILQLPKVGNNSDLVRKICSWSLANPCNGTIIENLRKNYVQTVYTCDGKAVLTCSVCIKGGRERHRRSLQSHENGTQEPSNTTEQASTQNPTPGGATQVTTEPYTGPCISKDEAITHCKNLKCPSDTKTKWLLGGVGACLFLLLGMEHIFASLTNWRDGKARIVVIGRLLREVLTVLLIGVIWVDLALKEF